MFEVCEVLLSPTQSHVALIGQRGITVLELPQRWGKKSEFEGGRIQINCKYVGFYFILNLAKPCCFLLP